MISIYTLSHPITKQVQYVGKTKNLKLRYYSHISDFDKITPNKAWVKSLVNNGSYPIMEEIDCVADDEWFFWEQFYCDLFKSWGFVLHNCNGWVHFKEPDTLVISANELLAFRHYLLPVPKYYLDAGLHDIDGEIWKDVPDYEGLYQVSNLGRMKSLSRAVQWNGCRRHKITSEIIMKLSNDKDGYKILMLRKKISKLQFRVHRLVLLAFIGQPPIGKKYGLHLDDNPANNYLNNLKWGDNSENEKQAYARGRKIAPRTPGLKGSKHSSSKKVIQMDLLGNEMMLHPSIAEAGQYCNIKPNNISSCLIKKQKTSGGFKWKYA